MSKRRTRWLIWAVPLALLATVLVPTFKSGSGSTEKQRIEQRAAGADCIVIDSNTKPGDKGLVEEFSGSRVPTTRVADPDAVRKLLGGIDFKSVFLRSHCMCFGEVALRFCQGDRELLALTFHHGQTLRVLDSNWNRNANLPLTAASSAFLAEWLKSYGYRPPVTSGPAPG